MLPLLQTIWVHFLLLFYFIVIFPCSILFCLFAIFKGRKYTYYYFHYLFYYYFLYFFYKLFKKPFLLLCIKNLIFEYLVPTHYSLYFSFKGTFVTPVNEISSTCLMPHGTWLQALQFATDSSNNNQVNKKGTTTNKYQLRWQW